MRVVDLTMKVSPATKVFPGSPRPSLLPWSRHGVEGYDSEVMFMSTHTGTHMDAPSHFAPGKAAIDGIPVHRFVSSAVLIDAPKKAGQTVGVADIKGEDIGEGDAVVLVTGWERRYRSRGYMTANPGLSGEAARYLVKKKVNAVCIDGPSIDPGRDRKFTVHNVLLPAGVLVVENLCNLGRLTEKRFTLVVCPLRLAGTTGSPVRALALL
jgi:kynurenine formamidase